MQGVEFICANTDAQALAAQHRHRHHPAGHQRPGRGQQAREGARGRREPPDDIRQAIAGAHMLFITAGMGGGTGTGAAPVIARIAKDMGISPWAWSPSPSTGKAAAA